MVRLTALSGCARHEDNAAAVADQSCSGLHCKENGVEVLLDGAMPVSVAHFGQRNILDGPDARAGDKDVQRAKLVDCRLCQRVGALSRGNVGSDGNCVSSGRPGVFDNRVRVIAASVIANSYVSTCRGEKSDGRGADAARPAGDECFLSPEVEEGVVRQYEARCASGLCVPDW